MELARNNYWIIRHGFSLANAQSLIVSTLENGVKPEYGLAALGKEQAEAAGKLLRQELYAGGGQERPLHIYSSPFSRTMETAAIVARQLAPQSTPAPVVEAEALAERFFGRQLELTECDDGYEVAWRHDAVDASWRPGGDGESVEQVAARVQDFLQELERRHEGANILLVSHGDTISITRALCSGGPLSAHRGFRVSQAECQRLGLGAAGVRAG